MSMLKLGAPRVIFERIRDQSGRVVTRPSTSEPTHVPIVFLLSEKQHDEPMYMFPSQIGHYLGDATIQRGSKYFSHQTQLLEIIAAHANPFLMYPVKVPGSKKAFVRLSVAVTEEATMESESMAMASIQPNYRLTWMNGVDAYPDELKAFGEAKPFEIAEGTTVYPILEMEMEYAGEYGNRFGIQIKAIDIKKSPQGITNYTIPAYTLSVIERLPSGGERIVKTVFGEDSIPFTLDPEVTDRLGRPLYLPLVFQQHYNINEGSVVENYGEFEEIHIYERELETVQEMLFETERQHDDLIPVELRNKWSLGDELSNAKLLNLFTGKMYDGETNYRSFIVDKAMLIGTGNVAYAKEGDSGIENLPNARARFNNANGLVDAFVYDLNSVISSEYSELQSRDRWDYSIVYDTGFAPEAKESLINLLATRKDITLLLTPMSYGELEIVPDVEIVHHEGYMRGVNNFQPIPFSRDTNIEVKGLITQLLADREINNFTMFVDGEAVEHSNFNIDSKGYWTASVPGSAFGRKASYQGLVHFQVEVSVVDHPEIPTQLVTSTKMEYNITPAALPVPTITQVWGGQSVPYTKAASEYQGALGAVVANITSTDGNLTELFDVVSAKFIVGDAKEYDITRQFVTWNQVYATPTRNDFLNGYSTREQARLVLRVRDRLSQEIKTVESEAYPYTIALPNVEPVVAITSVNGGHPVIPNYAGLNAPTVKIQGTVTGLGVDALLVMQKLTVKVAGVRVTNAVSNYQLAVDGQSATFEATVQRGFFPVMPSNDQNINVTSPSPGVIGESYHAVADVDVIIDYKYLHQSNGIYPSKDDAEVYVSDIVGMQPDWDGVVDYSDPILDLADPNDGIILVASIPETQGIENVGVDLTGSFIDYQEIVSAKATLNGGTYDLKVLNNFTVGAARIIKDKFWPNYAKSGNIALELIVKHRSGHNVTMNFNRPYSVNYPEMVAVTTKVESINTNNQVWFDETWSNPEKTVPVTGSLTGLHTLRTQKTIDLKVNGVSRGDVVVNINRVAGTWTAELPVKYMDLNAGGNVKLDLTLTYQPDKRDDVAVATALAYQVKKVTLPTYKIDSVNNGKPVSWNSAQNHEHKTEIIVGAYQGEQAVTLDQAIFAMNQGNLTINDINIPANQVNWSVRQMDGVNKLVATVATNYLIYPAQPFASSGVAVAKISISTLHNQRPYELLTAPVSFEIEPKVGDVVVNVDRYNMNKAIDPLNDPLAVYTLTGTVSGLAPFQDIDKLIFSFQGFEVNANSVSLGVATTGEDGFVTRPYTATFTGANHLNGITMANLAGKVDDQSTSLGFGLPTAMQTFNRFGQDAGNVWDEQPAEETDLSAYMGVINVDASIRNTISNKLALVSSDVDLTYTVIPKRAMAIALGSLTTQLLDPKTAVINEQERKVINFNFGMARSEYEALNGIEVTVGSQLIPANEITYHLREMHTGVGEGAYQNYYVEMSIPNKYIVNNGEYQEVPLPFTEFSRDLGVYKAALKVGVAVRDLKTNAIRQYQSTAELYSRAYFSTRATTEILSINNDMPINRWADPDSIIPVRYVVRDLYSNAHGEYPTSEIYLVDGRKLDSVVVDLGQGTENNGSFYNSLNSITYEASVGLSDLVELMSIWANDSRVEPYQGTLSLTTTISDANGKTTNLAPATKLFTAVEILPAAINTLNIASVNGGATIILNSTSTAPVEVKAIVDNLHPKWGETIDPERVEFGLNGQIVPRGDYSVSITNGIVDSNGQLDATITILASREVYNRYFTDEFLEIDETAFASGVPTTGTARVNVVVSSNYGDRITLTEDKTFLAGVAVEGPEDDVTVGTVDGSMQLITHDDGYRIVDLTSGDVLAEGDNVEALIADAESRGFVTVDALTVTWLLRNARPVPPLEGG